MPFRSRIPLSPRPGFQAPGRGRPQPPMGIALGLSHPSGLGFCAFARRYSRNLG